MTVNYLKALGKDTGSYDDARKALKVAIHEYDQAIWDYIASMLFLSPPIPPGVQVQYHEY